MDGRRKPPRLFDKRKREGQKIMWKRIGLVAVSVVLLFSMAGCNIATVNEERDNKQVVAVVNGEEILKEEILKQFNTYDQTYDFSSDEEQRKSILAQLVSSAVNSKILEQRAGDLGVSLSEEEIQAIDDEIQMMRDEIQKAAELTVSGSRRSQ